MFNFLKNCQTAFQSGCTFVHFQHWCEGSSFSTSLLLLFSFCSIIAILVGVEWHLIVVLFHISLTNNDVFVQLYGFGETSKHFLLHEM